MQRLSTSLKRRIWVLLLLSLSLVFYLVGGRTRVISGTVRHGEELVLGAVVRLQTTEIHTVSGPDGRFTLVLPDTQDPVNLTAWAAGYYIAGIPDIPREPLDLEIQLEPHADSDNPAYTWLPSKTRSGTGENQGCAGCHSNAGTDFPAALPYDEWLQDAHSQSSTNPRFLTMYLGTDSAGNQSPPTTYSYARDYGNFPLPPDPNQPYFGPGYKLDFPDSAGNCAACHTPAAAINDAYGTDPSSIEGVAAEGIPCDFCHKVWDVRLDPATGLPYNNAPGVLSFSFRRPPDGHQFFAGPFDDVAPGEDTYSPLQQQSQFCAPCHYGIFWDTVVYNSFGEWLASPYSDPDTGRTCQDCHMPPAGVTHFARPDQGGLARSPEAIFSHRMPGAADTTLLENAVRLTAEASIHEDQVQVQVEILNDQTGHHVPTDSPLRQMILLVEVRDSTGQLLAQTGGPTVPGWGGVGSPEGGNYGGLPGQGYARILSEIWTQASPTGAYWNPTRVASDNRIAALDSDRTRYSFAIPAESAGSAVEVHIRLVYRRAFKALVDQKGWTTPDILMEEIHLTAG